MDGDSVITLSERDLYRLFIQTDRTIRSKNPGGKSTNQDYYNAIKLAITVPYPQLFLSGYKGVVNSLIKRFRNWKSRKIPSKDIINKGSNEIVFSCDSRPENETPIEEDEEEDEEVVESDEEDEETDEEEEDDDDSVPSVSKKAKKNSFY